MASSMFTQPSMSLLGIGRELTAIVPFTIVSQIGNSVCPLHDHTVEERESVKASSFARTPINFEIHGHLDSRLLQNLHRRYHCIS